MLSEVKFNQVIEDLRQLGTKGHARLVVRKGVLRTKSHGSWLQRLIQVFYKPKNERIETVAKCALKLFQEHQEYITDTTILQRFVPLLHKGKCGVELEELILQINEDSSETVSVETTSTSIIDDPLSEVSLQEITDDPKRDLYELIINEAIDIAGDNNSILLYIAVDQAKVDLDGALETVSMVENGYDCSFALATIAVEQAKLDLERGFETAREIQVLHWQSCALAKIAVLQSNQDQDGALATIAEAVDKAMEIRDQSGCLCCFKNIVKYQAKFDLGGAFETIRQIERISDRVSDLAEPFAFIGQEQAKINQEAALATADRIDEENTYHRNMVKLAIIVEKAKVDLTGALERSREFDSDYFRVKSLAKLAVVQDQIDHDRALEVLSEALTIARESAPGGIMGNIGNALELQDIAYAQAQIDPESWQETYDQCNHFLTAARCFYKYVTIQAKRDLNEALSVARSHESTEVRARALAKIATHL